MTEVQKAIEALLISTERVGINSLIFYMRNNGFFTCPCSTTHHLAIEGGLAEHSLNVCRLALMLNDVLNTEIPKEKVVIVSLLHDLGKAGQYGKPGYVPNMLKGRGKDAKPYQSPKKPYEVNTDLMPVDHEIRSIQIATKYIKLEEEEAWAILMHNGLYGTFKYQIPGHETPLYLILHMADMWASRVIENKEEVEHGGQEEYLPDH